jgi:hypothetical protein
MPFLWRASSLHDRWAPARRMNVPDPRPLGAARRPLAIAAQARAPSPRRSRPGNYRQHVVKTLRGRSTPPSWPAISRPTGTGSERKPVRQPAPLTRRKLSGASHEVWPVLRRGREPSMKLAVCPREFLVYPRLEGLRRVTRPPHEPSTVNKEQAKCEERKTRQSRADDGAGDRLWTGSVGNFYIASP